MLERPGQSLLRLIVSADFLNEGDGATVLGVHRVDRDPQSLLAPQIGAHGFANVMTIEAVCVVASTRGSTSRLRRRSSRSPTPCEPHKIADLSRGPARQGKAKWSALESRGWRDAVVLGQTVAQAGSATSDTGDTPQRTTPARHWLVAPPLPIIRRRAERGNRRSPGGSQRRPRGSGRAQPRAGVEIPGPVLLRSTPVLE